ncbi:helix-turn-helix domain-containing protein [Endothiovibrio diazotrophicus]
MHRRDIQAAIRKVKLSESPERYLSQQRIAEELGVSPTSVGNVIAGRCSSARIEKAISRHTKIPLHTLWPKRYGPDFGAIA